MQKDRCQERVDNQRDPANKQPRNETSWVVMKGPERLLFFMATAVLWSLGGLLIKWVSLSPWAVAGYRSAIALPVLLIYFKRQAVNFSAAQLIGGASYAATVILFVYATKLTTAGNAILLQYTAPVYVALFSGWLLNEKIRWFDWAAIAAVLLRHGAVFHGSIELRRDDGQYSGDPLRSQLRFTCPRHAQSRRTPRPPVPPSWATC